MAFPKFGNVLVMAAGLALLVWSVYPPSSLVVDKSCNVVGFRPSVSEALFGRTFWNAQLDAAIEARQWQERLPAMLAKAKRDSEWSVSPIESRMTHLSDPTATEGSEAREKAEAEEQRQRLEAIAWLSSCEASFRARLQE
jgi:hypothetical protein